MYTFLGQVLLNLLFQTNLALVIAERPDVEEHVRRNILLYVVASFGLILSLAFANASQPVRLLLLTSFSAVTGALMSQNRPSKDVLRDVVALFVAFLVAGVVSAALGLDLRSLYLALFIGLLALVIMRVFNRGMNLATLGTFLFGLFVIVDTNAILQKNYNGDFVQATLDYFLDFINLLSFVEEDS